MTEKPRETQAESHVVELKEKVNNSSLMKHPFVSLSHRRITLTVRPGSTAAKREKVIHEWHKALLHEAVPPLVHKWEARLGDLAPHFRTGLTANFG